MARQLDSHRQSRPDLSCLFLRYAVSLLSLIFLVSRYSGRKMFYGERAKAEARPTSRPHCDWSSIVT